MYGCPRSPFFDKFFFAALVDPAESSGENRFRALCPSLCNFIDSVNTVQQLGKRGIQNSELREFARVRKLILITYDREFLSLVPHPDEQIIVITVHPNVDRKVLPVFKRFLESFDFTHLPGALIRVSEEEFVLRRSLERE